MFTNVQVGLEVSLLHHYEEEVERELEGTEEGESIEDILACEVSINLMSKASGDKMCGSITDNMTRQRRERIVNHNIKFDEPYIELNEDLWA